MSDKPDLKVIQFTGGTTGKVPADKVKKGIPKGMESLVVVGLEQDGSIYFASTDDVAETNWLLDIAKLELMEMAFPGGE